MRDKSEDLYFFRRKELSQILNDLSSIIGDLRIFLDEERRLYCESWDSDREEVTDDF